MSDNGEKKDERKEPVQASQESGLTPEEAAQANLPASPGTTPEPEVRGERRGMFGVRNGGDTTGYQIPFNVHYTGVKTKGTFDPAAKKFTQA